MGDLTRRTALYGIAAGSAAALAGCTEAGDPVSGGDGTDGGDPGDGSDGGDGADGDGSDDGDDDSGDGTDDGDDGTGEVTIAVHQVGEALSGPAWDRTERRGFCVLIAAENEDASWLLGEASERTRAFVEETDFAESVLVYVESVGPTTCHNEIAFDGVGVEGGTLVADATVRGAESEDVACGPAITYPAALLRVTSDPLPDAARLSVTDGWGETGTVRSGDSPAAPQVNEE